MYIESLKLPRQTRIISLIYKNKKYKGEKKFEKSPTEKY
jgi:hypothetical protein